MKVLVAAGALVQIMVAGAQTQQFTAFDFTYFNPYYTIFENEYCPKEDKVDPVDPGDDPAHITAKIEDLIGKIQTLTEACEEFEVKKEDL